MTGEETVVGLDIGTTKVCTVVGHGDAEGKITITGVSKVPSRGIKKGVVIDVEDTVIAIRDSVERARHMAGLDIEAVVVGVTGDHVQSANRRGSVTVAGPGNAVTQRDVERVLQAAALEVPEDREIIHSLPRDFVVDGHHGVRRPIGMCGQRLEVETHIVTGVASFLQNVVQCVERADLRVNALVLEPIATIEAVATSDERDLGVALIDIGGGTSDIAIFLDGSIVHSAVLPVGGNHVTRDISIGLRTPFEIAERLKIDRGVAAAELIPHGEALEIVTAGSGERLRLPRAILGEIIEARMSELFDMARRTIQDAGVQRRLPAGVILTGGGALLPGAVELAQQTFDLPVRLGKPIEITGWSDQVNAPQFSTGVGLLRFALRQRTALSNATSVSAALANAAAGAQRRVWSVPVADSGDTSDLFAPSPQPSTSSAASPIAQNPSTPGASTSPGATGAGGSSAPSTGAARAGERGRTLIFPSDRRSTTTVNGTGEAKTGEANGQDRGTTPFDNLRHEAQTRKNLDQDLPLWQKWWQKLRQWIGFEAS